MARTKASVGAKVSSGKSSKARCSVAPSSSSGSSSGSSDKASRNHSGGNPVCHRETPKWQRQITNFFVSKDPPVNGNLSNNDDGETAGSSKSKPKRNVIQSDDEEDQPTVNGETSPQNGEDEEAPKENGEDDPKTVQNGEEQIQDAEKPTNHVLDDTIELEPLTGESSHKIDEYYSKNAKGKGKGKKTKGKENLDVNTEKRNSIKRDLDQVNLEDESPRASKRVKVN